MKQTPSGQPSYKRIGLFDSGVGGLTVLKQLTSSQPGAQFVYLGDSARLPYGNRSAREIAHFVREIVGFLTNFKLDALVMACNTSAALAAGEAELVAEEWASQGQGTKKGKGGRDSAFEVFNLIQPASAYLAGKEYGHIGVLATSATARSRAFGKALEALNFDCRISEIGCPTLVPLIESGRLGEGEIEAALNASLKDYLLKMAGAQAIVLGCTHFPFLESRIEDLLKGSLRAAFPELPEIIDPARLLAIQLYGQKLQTPNLVASALADFDLAVAEGRLEIFVTGDVQAFKKSAELCLGFDIGPVKQIALSALAESYIQSRQRQAALITRSGSYQPVLLKPAMAPAGLFV